MRRQLRAELRTAQFGCLEFERDGGTRGTTTPRSNRPRCVGQAGHPDRPRSGGRQLVRSLLAKRGQRHANKEQVHAKEPQNAALA